ncbi:IFN-alpha/beta-receptor-like secreted glycoprotein [Yokapox virus]|uniref:Soluble interferon alpha/beta receptor OPG204 n=1 Tax=Yokapox virus TaxID=1076255 RepID=G3EI59_9POXV|nr:IFN-alpha/beta-receptor-like secreted glycoprotein [Yokapox virus]AEN03756.1 IFN-alpha/beta-receptor-like secreted glycoprotein [Yokapox virus]
MNILKVLFISLVVIINIVYSYNISNETAEWIEYYEAEKTLLPYTTLNMLNESCQYGGIKHVFGAEGEPLYKTCPVISNLIKDYLNGSIDGVKWQYVGDPDNKVHVVNNTLWIPNVGPSNLKEGYICTIHNKKNCVQAVLNILKLSKRCSDVEYELGVRKKNKILITCGVLYDRDYYRIKWYKNNKRIKVYEFNNGTEKYERKNGGKFLYITNITKDDDAVYKCKAYYNMDNRSIISTACKRLYVLPKQNHDFDVITNPVVKVRLGEPANTTCVVVGKSITMSPFREWQTEEGEVLPYDDNVAVFYNEVPDGDMLYFINVTEDIIGRKYICSGYHYGVEKKVMTTIVLDDSY